MNIFAGTIEESAAGELLTETKAATAETETAESRGPPTEGKASRDLEERHRALRKGEMVNEFRDKVNWRRYYQKIISAEYNPDYFDDGAIAMMELDGALLTLEMQRNGEWSVIKLEENSYGSTEQGREAHSGENGNTQVSGKRKGHSDVGDAKGAGQRGSNQRSGSAAGQEPDGQRNDAGSTEVSAVNDETQAKYSRDLETLNDLRKQNENLREQVDYWKGQTKKTEQPSLRQEDIDKLAKRLIKKYDSMLEAKEISGELKALGEYIKGGI